MKKITIILLIFSALTLTTCKKLPELKVYELNLANENVAYSQTSAEITVDYEYPTKLQYVNVTMSRSNYFDYSFVARAEVKDSVLIANFVDLQTDKNYYYKFEYSNGVNVVTSDVRSFYLDAANVTLPTVVTKEVTNIMGTSAKCGGTIIDDGGYYVTARGVCWNTQRNPTIFDNYTTDGMNTGEYTSTMTDLEEAQVYYVRAFAINEKGTSYGTEYSFETIPGGGGEITLPTVITGDVTNITSTTASCGGNVTNTGGAIVTQRGVCWSTNENPTISDSHTTDGTGAGSFTSNLTGLTENTTYYVRAYATNQAGTSYGEQKSFTTEGGGVIIAPTVTTSNVTNITSTSAICGGVVANSGGADVTARGVCWSTTPGPTISDAHTTDETGTGSFTSNLTNLSTNTVYYVKAYATNSAGTSYGEEKRFITLSGGSGVMQPTVTTNDVFCITSDYAFCDGNVVADGGAEVTARGVCWSTSQTPTVEDSHTTDGTGTGTYTSYLTNLTANTTYYVRSYATNSSGNSYGQQISFTTLSGSGTNINAPTGAIPGLFSVSENTQVYFSQGNLQYQASTDTWRFAENQYDYVGGVSNSNGQLYGNVPDSRNNNISPTYTGWIDLFGWGTSGYNHGAVCYQPWSTSQTNSDYYAYGSPTYNLNDQTGQADWGFIAISNGGNANNIWRTLTRSEWVYLKYDRQTSSGMTYINAQVADVDGYILLPDNWNADYYSFNGNGAGAGYSYNVISSGHWRALEIAGAVFLPAAGNRNGTYFYGGGFNGGGAYGYYWLGNYYNDDNAQYFAIWDDHWIPNIYYERHYGLSVRLVRDAE